MGADKPRLAQCPRCKAFGLVDDRDGIRVALDVAPLDALGYGSAVASRVGLWWVREGADGRPGRLRGYTTAQRPLWGPGGSQTAVQGFGRLHREHGCGAPARSMVLVPVTAPKGSAPATHGAAAAGNPRRTAPVAGGKAPAPSPATPASPRLSDRAVRCHDCRKIIDQGSPFLGIAYDNRWKWAVHEECS